jgi:hypothetical protein
MSEQVRVDRKVKVGSRVRHCNGNVSVVQSISQRQLGNLRGCEMLVVQVGVSKPDHLGTKYFMHCHDDYTFDTLGQVWELLDEPEPTELAPLSIAFAEVAKAMMTEEGGQLCWQRWGDELMPHKPDGVTDSAWVRFVTAFKDECIENEPRVPVGKPLAALTPQVVELLRREKPKQHTPPQGPWLGRRGARR